MYNHRHILGRSGGFTGVSAGFPGEEHVLQHLKPESQLRSKKADGGCVFGGPCCEDAGFLGKKWIYLERNTLHRGWAVLKGKSSLGRNTLHTGDSGLT